MPVGKSVSCNPDPRITMEKLTEYKPLQNKILSIFPLLQVADSTEGALIQEATINNGKIDRATNSRYKPRKLRLLERRKRINYGKIE